MIAEPPWGRTFVDGVEHEWVRLVAFGSSGLSVGVSRAGRWLVGDETAAVLVASGQAGVRVLAILEQPPAVTRQSIAAQLENYGLTVDEGIDLPFVVAITVALSGPATWLESWGGLALSWLDVVPLSSEIRVRLERMVDAKQASQRARHRAAQILRREGVARPDECGESLIVQATCADCGGRGDVYHRLRAGRGELRYSGSFRCRGCGAAWEQDGREVPEELRAGFLEVNGCWAVRLLDCRGHTLDVLRVLVEYLKMARVDALAATRNGSAPISQGTYAEAVAWSGLLRAAGAAVEMVRQEHGTRER
jgi:DNA-directed RNA polymerase subunit M/transcription elongation factor TFIIS